MEMKQVYSSWVAEIGYDAETETLVYKTRGGTTIIHPDVPLDIAEKVGAIGEHTPPSIGEALHEFVRGRFPRSNRPEGVELSGKFPPDDS